VVKKPLGCDGSHAAEHRLTQHRVSRLTYRSPLEAQHAPDLWLGPNIWARQCTRMSPKEKSYRIHQKARRSSEWSSSRARFSTCVFDDLSQRPSGKVKVIVLRIACKDLDSDNPAPIVLHSRSFPRTTSDPHPDFSPSRGTKAFILPVYHPSFLLLQCLPSVGRQATRI
jgi:hypothetical protein